MTDHVRARAEERPTVHVGASGGGQPVVDLLRDRVRSGEVVPVTLTAGDRRTERWERGLLRVSLGKSFMVSQLQALLGSGRLHLPKTGEAAVLTEELLAYELRVDVNGHERFGAFRTGAHDELATAAGLATQVDPVDGPMAPTLANPSTAAR